MGAIRIIILALVIWLVWRLLQNRLQKTGKNEQTRNLDYGKMVRCSHCNTHLPASQALQKKEKWLCNECQLKHNESE